MSGLEKFILQTLFVVLLAPCGLAQEQEYLFETMTFKQGLSDNRVRSIQQDARGFIWVSTAYGLNRFDGYTFWRYLPDKKDSTSISSFSVNRIVKDHRGRLWFATGNGICRLRKGRWMFERVFCYPKQIKEMRYAYFENVYCDSLDQLWAVNSHNQIYHIDPQRGTYETLQLPSVPNAPAIVPPEERHKPPRPTWVGGCGDSAVCIGTTYGYFLYHLRKHNFRFVPVDQAWPFGLFNIIPGKEPNVYWCSVYLSGVIKLNVQSGAYEHFPPPESTPNTFMLLPNGKIWAGGASGLSELDPATRQYKKIRLPFEEDLSSNTVSIFQDRAGAIWIGTDNGLLKYDPFLQGFHYTEVHREVSTIFENDIYDICHDPDRQLWYVSSRQQAAVFVLDSLNRLQHRISTLPWTEPTRIFRDSKKRVWVTTRFKVFRLDTKNWKLILVPTPARREKRGGVIWSVAEDPRGRLWFGISRDGIFIYDPETGSTEVPGPETGFTALRIYKIVIDRGGKYAWVATDNEGFFECDLATMRFRRYDDKIKEGLLAGCALVQDADGKAWIGTPEGLIRYDPAVAKKEEAFRLFTMDDGLPMNMLEGGILDHQGRLWFGAGDRLVRFDPRTFRPKTFDYRYGASRTPFGYSDLCASPGGELYAGGRRGFLRWRPETLLENPPPPVVVVTNLRVLQRNIPAPTSRVGWISMAPGENSFSVEFAALNYTLPGDHIYQWKLEGYDKEWSEPSKQRQASYGRVPPGDYVLLVKAASGDGKWNEEPLRIQVYVHPHFWETWWFRTLLLLVTGGLTYAFFRWRVQQLRERDRLKAEFSQRLAEVEMSALRAQMNPHFIFNCLNSINRFILLNQPLDASQYLTKFSRLIRLVLDNSISEMISLEKELETLGLYITMEAVRFEDRFQYRIDIDAAVETDSIDIPPMIIQPYVENAIWHGLLHKKGNDGLLEISVTKEKDYLVIHVTDNGVGRTAARALKSKSAPDRKSHGMAVTAERLKLLSKLHNRPIHAHVDDLTHPDGSAAGTRVVLTIPILG